MLNNECLELINEWLYHNDKCKEINKILYNNTELYEQKYMIDFKDDLFRYFAGKITRYSRDYNQLMEILSNEERKRLNIIKVKRR